MPSGKTKFNHAWLSKLDNNGQLLSKWCKEDSSNSFAGFCVLCKKSISCSTTGAIQLNGHADGQRHKDKLSDPKQKLLMPTSQVASTSKQGGGDVEQKMYLHPVSVSDQVTKAEALWAMQVAAGGYSYTSCEHIAGLFKAMFPGTISDKFTMSKSKVSYLISDGLGPYFRKETTAKIRAAQCPFTIQFDETSNAQHKK